MLRLEIEILFVALCAPNAISQNIGINVLLNASPDANILAQLECHGQVRNVIPEINGVIMKAEAGELAAIQALPFVVGANPDTQYQQAAAGHRKLDGFGYGANQWSLDAVNVTDFGIGRAVAYDGEGVYVAVVDDGFPFGWRDYLPEERVDVLHARSFAGGGGEVGTVSAQPYLWEHANDYHGIACASIILGFRYVGPLPLPLVFNGVAPGATVIPINVFHNAKTTWGSVVARAIIYVADLKAAGALGNAPVVISWSGGTTENGVLEQAAIDYAIAHGVVVVAAAGNDGAAGMLFPGRYPPVISVAASGNVQEFPADDPTRVLWIERDVPENDPFQHFMASFTAVALPGQDLDVAAPGYNVPTPWAEQNGQPDYSFFFGTSAATPHVAGIVALMLQKNPTLSAAQVESILESTAMPLLPGCRNFTEGALGPGNPPTWSDAGNVSFVSTTVCWGANVTGHGIAQADSALAATPLP